MFLRRLAVAVPAILAGFWVGAALADTITLHDFNSDATSGISSSNTYTQ